MTVKEQAIAKFQEDKIQNAKDVFQGEVNSILREITEYSHQLSIAKKRLLDLEYKEPEFGYIS